MTDELVKRLRAVDHMSLEDCFCQSSLYDQAADRIEQLTAELADAEALIESQAKDHASNNIRFAEAEHRAKVAEAERDRLREALLDHNDLLRSAIAIAEREGVRGEIASTNWDAYYNRAAVVLKRHHQITTDARAALKGESHE